MHHALYLCAHLSCKLNNSSSCYDLETPTELLKTAKTVTMIKLIVQKVNQSVRLIYKLNVPIFAQKSHFLATYVPTYTLKRLTCMYHAYATISNRQKQFLLTHVLTSATDSFNIHTSLLWLDPSLSLHMHVSSNYNGNYHVCTHAIQRVEREGSSHTRLHTHMSVHCGYRDMMSI